MIHVRLRAHPSRRPLDEHVDAISLLHSHFCQGKSRPTLVTILTNPRSALRYFNGLRNAHTRKSPFGRCRPWKLG
jgi:hypothetical protein